MTVKNGTVRNFDVGVVIEGGSGNIVTGINAGRQHLLRGRPRPGRRRHRHPVVEEQPILRNSTINNGAVLRYRHLLATWTRPPRATAGVSSGNVLDGNLVQGNIQGRTPNNVVNNDNIGIRLEPGNTANLIVNNRVEGNGLDGITLFVRNTFTTIRGNR